MKFIYEANKPYFYKYSLLEGIQKDFKELHGDKLFTDFMSVRNKLETPYNDMSYWMKKSSEELEDFINKVEIKKSNSEVRREEKQGATLVYQAGKVKIYFITTYESMKYYGKGTKWCIAGNYAGHEERGQKYFNSYIRDYNLNGGYYVLTDGENKYCVLISNKKIHSIWNAEDKSIPVEDLPREFFEALSASEITNSAKEFVIENGVLKEFHNIYNKTEIEIPNSVMSIGDSVFDKCTRLTSIIIPSSITSIGNFTFKNCAGLTSIMIPDSVTSIGEGAFYGCAKLKNFMIPDSVTSISDSAFYYCTKLVTITLPSGITSIGSSAFSECTGLTTISIPSSVTSIGDGAFYNCTGLTSITIPSGVMNIGDWTFAHCTGLIAITIPSGITNINLCTFLGCSSLTKITIPSGVTTIDESAFYGCTGLTAVSIPDSVVSINDTAFSRCESLSDVYYSGSEKDWNSIDIEPRNDYLLNANIHFNSKIKNESLVKNNKMKFIFESNDGTYKVIKAARKDLSEDKLTPEQKTKYTKLFLGLDRNNSINAEKDLDVLLDDEEDRAEIKDIIKREQRIRKEIKKLQTSRSARNAAYGLDKIYPYYISFYRGYPIYEPAEGGYYYSGNSLTSLYGYDSYEEALADFQNKVAEFTDYCEGSFEYYEGISRESRTRVSWYGKYVDDNATLVIENNKQVGKEEKGWHPYE